MHTNIMANQPMYRFFMFPTTQLFSLSFKSADSPPYQLLVMLGLAVCSLLVALSKGALIVQKGFVVFE